MVDIPLNFLPNITYDANGNILVNGAPIPGTGPVNLDPPPGDVLTNAAGAAYVPSGNATDFAVDRSDAEAVLNSPFAQTNLFSDSDLDGYADDTGDPNLFEDLLLQGADTRKGLNDTGEAMYADPNTGELLSEEDYFALYPPSPITPPNVTINDDGTRVNTDPVDGVKYHFAADGTLTGVTDADGVFTSYVDNNDPPPPPPPPATITTMADIANFLTEGGLGSTANFFREGSATADQVRDYLSGDRLDEFNALMAGFDPSTYTYEGNYSFNPNNPAFGAGSGRETVYAYNPITGEATMMNAAEAAELGYQTFTTARDLLTAYPQLSPNNTEPEPTPTDTINYQDLYTNLLNQITNNQPTQTTQTTDMSGLMGLLNSIYRQPSYGYGGGMGYGNPFFGGYGYGYGMNPYAGGIGSFYGNMGSGYSPSMYGSPFYGMYGGQNYNQRPMYSMPYNPYSTLYNQYSSPGFGGDMYTTDYQSYLDTPFEGQKYSQDYQDYLSTNNPSVYNNLFGTA